MNICVIGGGGPTGKFGRDFCDRARDEGHNVYVLSHKNHKQTDHRQMWANFKNIETNIFQELSQLKQTRLVNFIRSNYLQNKDNVFSPQSENILPYFTGHNTKAFISFYNEENLMMDLKKAL